MIALYIVGSLIITFFAVIFIIATIRVLRQSKSQAKGRTIETLGTGEQVIAVIERNGQKEFIK